MTKREANERYRDKTRPQRRRRPHLTLADFDQPLPPIERRSIAMQAQWGAQWMSAVPIEQHVLKGKP